MAKQADGTPVKAKVLRTFRDKYTNKLVGKGTEFLCDEKRVAEINFGQAKPIVMIVGAKPEKKEPAEPEETDAQTTPPAGTEETDAQTTPPAGPEEADTQTPPPAGPEEADTQTPPPAAQEETKPKGKGKTGK